MGTSQGTVMCQASPPPTSPSPSLTAIITPGSSRQQPLTPRSLADAEPRRLQVLGRFQWPPVQVSTPDRHWLEPGTLCDCPPGHSAGTTSPEPLSRPPLPDRHFLLCFFFFFPDPLQHYSLSIARDCFLEFLSRRKCVFLRNRCSSLKPNFR